MFRKKQKSKIEEEEEQLSRNRSSRPDVRKRKGVGIATKVVCIVCGVFVILIILLSNQETVHNTEDPQVPEYYSNLFKKFLDGNYGYQIVNEDLLSTEESSTVSENQNEEARIHTTIPRLIEFQLPPLTPMNLLPWSTVKEARLGMAPNDVIKDEGEFFYCDGKKQRKQIINDNFCDCEDATDEPTTSACSSKAKSKIQGFYCNKRPNLTLESNKKNPAIGNQIAAVPTRLPLSFVNDGICDDHDEFIPFINNVIKDCCDGTDEWESPNLCIPTCSPPK